MAALAAGYSLLSVFYLYEDFFKYLARDSVLDASRAGVSVPVNEYLLTILSPWRPLGAALAVLMLAVAASALWRGRPRARALALISLWGVLFPQLLWYMEFVVDWHGGQALAHVMTAALLAAGLPTLLLVEPGRPLADWSCLNPNRLLGLAIACAWIGFAATEFLDHSYQLESWTAYIGAAVAIPLAGLAVAGIYAMRAWGLWAGVGAAIGLAMVPLASSWTSYWYTGGYSDSFWAAAAGSQGRIAVAMILPLAVVWVLAGPYLHAFLGRLRRP